MTIVSPNNEYRYPELWVMSLAPEVHRPPLAGLIARTPLLLVGHAMEYQWIRSNVPQRSPCHLTGVVRYVEDQPLDSINPLHARTRPNFNVTLPSLIG